MNVDDYLSLLESRQNNLQTQVDLLQQEILNMEREIKYLKTRKKPEPQTPLSILNEEEWELILRKLSPEDLLTLCHTSTQFEHIIVGRLKLNKAALLIEKVFPIIVPYLSEYDLLKCSLLSKKWRLLVALNWRQKTTRGSSSVDFTSIQKMIRFLHQSHPASSSFFIGRAVTFDCVEDITGRFWEVAVDLLSKFGEFICHLELLDYPDRSAVKYYEITFQCLANLANLRSINIGWGVDLDDIRVAEQVEIAEYCRTHSYPPHPHLRQLTLHLGMPDFQAGAPTDFLLRSYSNQLTKVTIRVDSEDVNLNLNFSSLVELSFGEIVPLQQFTLLDGSNFPRLKKLTFRHNPKLGELDSYFQFLSQFPNLLQLSVTSLDATSVNRWCSRQETGSFTNMTQHSDLEDKWAGVWNVLPKLQRLTLSPVLVTRDGSVGKDGKSDGNYHVLERLL